MAGSPPATSWTTPTARPTAAGAAAALEAERCLAARNATQVEQEPAAVPA
ncbi:hypothetical protein ACH49O_30340 [Streptomyces coeruleorubidus]